MSSSPQRESYFRSDIQGLRGIAVLLVVIYHTGFAFPGGFIGVDMFFVISGFVITQVLLREYEETGKISLSHFYARRARRLIPALSVVTIFTLLISLVAMSPFGEQQQIIKTALASTFFAGNIHLFAMNSYEALKDNPLRHLWSLGVEEQFYWIYPILFIGILRVARKRFYSTLTILLSGFAGISFVFGMLLTNGFEFGYTSGSSLSSQFSFLAKLGFEPGGDWPAKFAFFGAPARFWEILLGSLTALAVKKFTLKFRFNASLLVIAAIAALVWSSVTLNSRSAFPGVLALLPVLGTVLLIFFNREVGPVNRLLTSSPLVYLGDISYSLYLWHWPLIVFSRAIWPSSELFLILSVLLAFFCSKVSHRMIEVRFVHVSQKRNQSGPLIISALVVVTLFAGISLQGVANTGLGIPKVTNKWENIASRSGCELGTDLWDASCRFGSPSRKFTAVLIGDSNARSASDGVLEAINLLDGAVHVSHQSGCSALIVTPDSNCREFNENRFNAISERRPDLIVLVNYQNYFVDTPNSILLALRETLDFFSQKEIPVVVQGQIPECSESISVIRLKIMEIDTCKVQLLDQERRNYLVRESKKIALAFSRNTFVDPADALCPSSKCQSFFDGKWTYSDQRHLSPTGSKMLTPLYVEAIKEILEQR